MANASIDSLARGFDQIPPATQEVATSTYSFFSLGAFNATGGGVIVLALLVGLLAEQRKVWAGQSPSWSTPILRTILFVALLSFYNMVAQGLIQGVLSFGSLDAGAVEATSRSVLAARAQAFAEMQQKFQGDNAALNLIGTGLSTLMEALLNIITSGSFVFAAAIVFVLKIVQGIMLKVLYVAGPLMIGVAAIPHPTTSKYLEGWIVAVVEVGLWGFIGKIFLAAMSRGWNSGNLAAMTADGGINFFEFMIFNIVYGFAFLSIPLMSAMIVRGASGAAAGSGPLGAAMGAAAAAVAAIKGAGAHATGAGRSFADKARGGDEGTGGGDGGSARAGDQGSASDTQLGATSTSSARSGDAAAERRAHFARDGALRKQGRDRDE